MANRSKVSIVVPSHNHARYVVEAVRSALDDSVDGLEVVVVDDGSTDDSRERLRCFEKEERVRLFYQENRGAHDALNRGLRESFGDILFILNSDDAFAPGRVSALVDLLSQSRQTVLAASWVEIVDAEGRTLGIKHAWKDQLPWRRPVGPGLADLDDPALALLESNYVATTSNIAFRRCLLADRGAQFLPLRYAHDWEFVLAASRRGRIALAEAPLLRYRAHSGNTIREEAKGGSARGAMRYEILWLIARHWRPMLELAVSRGFHREDLEARAALSLPSFGCPGLLSQLIFLRGVAETPPAAYDRLVEIDHPFRRSASDVLADPGAHFD